MMRQVLGAFAVISTLGIVEARPDSLGDNGFRVDPYIVTLKKSSPLTGSSCYATILSKPDIAIYCGDDDGCTVRLASVGALRSQSPPVIFATDSLAEEWTRDNGINQPVMTGNSTDGNRKDVVESKRTDGDIGCLFRDDSTDFFFLVNCFNAAPEADSAGNHTCILRFDD